MKLYGFKGIEDSFEVEVDDNVIIVEYIDYTLREDGIDIHQIESSEPLNELDLAEAMWHYIDWELIREREWEKHEDIEEMYHEGN